MPSNQVPQIKSSMGIVRIAKELRERVNRLIAINTKFGWILII
jgi:hypothetical protein